MSSPRPVRSHSALIPLRSISQLTVIARRLFLGPSAQTESSLCWTTLKANDIRLQHRSPGEAILQFLIALFLFVVVVGLIDLRIKWPTARQEKNQ